MSSKSYRIACIPADGIGPEVIDAGVEVLKALSAASKSFSLDFEHYDWSSETYKKTGKYIPDGGLDELKIHDAILFGAVGAPDVPDHVSLWSLRLAICQGFQQYANVRPTKILRGIESPLRKASTGDLDWVIIRENSEGEYAGQGGRSHKGQPWEIATEVSIFTRHAVTRLLKFAFEVAQKREKKHITVVTKSNAQRNGMVMWDEIAVEVAKGFPDVKVEKMLVDAMTCRMVLQPQSLDTIVATNLVNIILIRVSNINIDIVQHADILSDLAAALAGSIGIAPTSNLDPTRQNPSMFEPIHGSAFDITGKGIANPVGTFWTAAEMLRIKPFTISVPQTKIDRLKQKLAVIDLPDELDDAGWDYGASLPEVKKLLKYWQNTYDWRKHEAELNELPNYNTGIRVDGFNELQIHFVHQKSEVKNAVPLLFCHGWPGNFTEVAKVLPLLADTKDGAPAFNIVAPSLPNFVFSEGVKKRGFGLAQHAEVCHKLMMKLGYKQYGELLLRVLAYHGED
ncbi:tartrate dehydrogenase [Aureobasidium subglaciale]|nr:tartrate dehydrogenase [Aureobasidium subglaciale]